MTRTKLLQARTAEAVPHPSFDMDGDGVVSPKDYFLARLFDKDGNGRLSASERATALVAIENGLESNFKWGLDKTGVDGAYRVI
jgi:hypothetical protein